jgi:glycosyltransferase involved in cell wall biosynthesis
LSAGPPLVSFVLLSYNYARFIGDTINSVLQQEGDYPFELIIVDDASTDNSHDVISAFSDPRITYLRHESNQGHAATVTDGLRTASGTYIARIDSDDRYRPHFLRTVIPLFERYPGVGLVYGDAAIMDSAGALTALTTDAQHNKSDFVGNEYVALLEKNFICAPTIIARREAWLAALPIPHALSFHDWWFTLQIARKWDFYFRNQVLADYRVHNANLHTRITLDKTEESSIMRLLNDLFAAQESSAELQRAKMAAKNRILGTHFLVLALKYFGAGMAADARRCYHAAIRHRPGYLSSAEVLRQLFATYIGLETYARIKNVVKRA